MSSKSTLVPFGTGVGVALRLLSTPISPSNRVREPVKPTTGRVVGYFPSVKNNRSIAWESQLEQKACYVFEFSPEIIKYREQPLSIYYRLNGELLRYTPDFELTLLSGELIYVEVKPGAKLQTLELQEKLGAISRYWKEKGLQFLIITDQELDHPILQSNLKLLRGYLRVKCDAELVQISVHWLMRRGIRLAKKTKIKRNRIKILSGQKPKKLYRRKIYERYSHLGGRNFITYAHKAAKFMNSAAIKKQLKPLWDRLQEEIKK